jgi:hypothetical protein
MEENREGVPDQPNDNGALFALADRAEIDVREVKRAMRRFKKKTGSPRRLWCFLGKLVATLRGLTAYDAPALQGRCATEHAFGITPDISPYIQHGLFDDVWYRDADGENRIGKWLGLAEKIGGRRLFLDSSSFGKANSTFNSVGDNHR